MEGFLSASQAAKGYIKPSLMLKASARVEHTCLAFFPEIMQYDTAATDDYICYCSC